MSGNRTSNTLVYAPQIQVLVATDTGVLDLSDDIVNGQVRRVVNGVSQFSCTINNRNQKYTGVLKRMDRITVSFARIGKWIQVFSGYLDSVPAIALYTSTASIRASCTLKRLMNTWWDPQLPSSQAQILNQSLYDNGTDGGTQANGKESDSGIGKMLGNLLFRVGGWDKDQIKIQNIPAGFLDLALEVSVQQDAANATAVSNLKRALGLSSNPTQANNNPTVTAPQIPGAIKPPTAKNGKYSLGELVAIVRSVGFTGDNIVTAALIAYFNSGGLPSFQSSSKPPGFIGPNNNFAGIFGLRVGVNDPLKVNTSAGNPIDAAVALSEALDPLTSAKILYDLTANGTNFDSGAKAFTFMPTAYNGRGTSQSWVTTAAQAKVLSTTVDNSIIIFSTAAQSGDAITSNTPGTQTVTVPAYTMNASQSYLQGIYGNSQAAVEANLVNITFQGFPVKVHKLAAAAFQKVDAQITALKSGYKARIVSTYNYRPMNNGTGTSTLSWHSYGIAIDINPDTNGFTAAGIGNGTHDIPDSWVAVFKNNNFTWGGDYTGSKDFMHFQWQGGSTYVGAVNSDGTLSGVGPSDQNSVQVRNPFEQNLFGYVFMGADAPGESLNLVGPKAPINDVQLLTTVQAITSASLRSFMSGPDGCFIAFYPDYFGVAGTAPVLTVEDIEMIDFSIDVSDDSLATDVFIAGGTSNEYNPSIDSTDWVNTAGVVNINQPRAMSLLLGVDSVNDPDFSANAIYGRFGLRPLKAEYPQVSTGVMEYLQALSLFQQKWAAQYATNVQFTFMPELYPGMRILIKSHQITVYTEEVVHSFGFDTGFQTSATLSAPASVGGGIKGMNLGRL